MKEPAMLYLIVGLPGAGKTTKAKQLEVEASLPEHPPGYEAWSVWAASRWPSFPNEFER